MGQYEIFAGFLESLSFCRTIKQQLKAFQKEPDLEKDTAFRLLGKL